MPTAANPTSTVDPDVAHIWYVMAAFDASTCPRLKAISFRIDYDQTKMALVAQGTDPADFELQFPSDIDGASWPAPGAGTGISFTVPKTSQLQEIYWFAGYAYSGQENVTFGLRSKSASDNSFVDDGTPSSPDEIAGFGVLGLGGTSGTNPNPEVPSPTDETSWGRVKQIYR